MGLLSYVMFWEYLGEYFGYILGICLIWDLVSFWSLVLIFVWFSLKKPDEDESRELGLISKGIIKDI